LGKSVVQVEFLGSWNTKDLGLTIL
jgi:hypothetical protein